MQNKTDLLFPLIKVLKEIKPLNKDLHSTLLDNFHEQQIKKGTILLHEGDVCKKLWFLADGLLRSYHNIGNK